MLHLYKFNILNLFCNVFDMLFCIIEFLEKTIKLSIDLFTLMSLLDIYKKVKCLIFHSFFRIYLLLYQ